MSETNAIYFPVQIAMKIKSEQWNAILILTVNLLGWTADLWGDYSNVPSDN